MADESPHPKLQTTDEKRAVLADVFIRRRQVLFDMSGNRAHLIAASRIAHYFGIAPPAWLSAARDRMDKALLESESVKDVAPAMGLHAAGGKFATKRAETEERDLAIVGMVDHFKTCDREPRSFTFPDGRRVEYGMDPELRRELELDGEFAVVGKRFDDLSADRVEEIYYDVKRKLQT